MLRSVEFHPANGQESLKINLSEDNRSGLIIEGIDGLGPVKAEFNSSAIAGVNGRVFNSSRINGRDITFNFIYDDRVRSIEETRNLTYRTLAINTQVRVVFISDTKTVEAVGYVESNSPNMFSPLSKTQISMVFESPYFTSSEQVFASYIGLTDGFEFPFHDNSNQSPSLEFGKIRKDTYQNIHYDGDYPTGILMEAIFSGPVTDFSIHNTTYREKTAVDTAKIQRLVGSALAFGDKITLSTVKGQKKITLDKSGKVYNILGCLGRDSTWVQIYPGDNVMAYDAVDGIGNIDFVVSYRPTFSGV